MYPNLSGIEYQVDLFAVFMLLGIGQGLFLSFIFLFRKGVKGQSSLFFGLLLLSLSLVILENFLCYTRYIFDVMYLFSFANSLGLAVGPLIFIYLYTRLFGKVKYKWLHFLPFILYFLYYLFYFNIQPEAIKYNAYIRWYDLDLPQLADVSKIKYWFVNSLGIQHFYRPIGIIHYGSYLGITLLFLLKYLKNKGTRFFSIKDGQSRWFRSLVVAFILVFIVEIYLSLVVKIGTGNYLNSTLLSGLMYFVSFNYISHSSFFSSKELRNLQSGKYAKSALTEDSKREILRKITKVMVEQELFKDNLFSLSILSKETGTTFNHLSQVINECLNQNFYEFLASYRIDEAKRMLNSPDFQNLSIEQLAFEVGYNSTSAFNTAFRKICGKTPSEFRKAKLEKKIISSSLHILYTRLYTRRLLRKPKARFELAV